MRRILQALFREKILSSIYRDKQLVFTLSNNCQIYVTDAKIISLSRLSEFKEIYMRNENMQAFLINNPLNLLKLIIRNQENLENRKKWQILYGEIENHLQNASLAILAKNRIDTIIKRDNLGNHFSTLFQWIKQQNFADWIFSEQFVTLGHPHHPCNKTKLGFSEEDVMNYSPEFSPNVPIFIAAAPKQLVGIQSIEEFDFLSWFSNYFPLAIKKWRNALEEKNYIIENYVPFPIHPWQAKKVLPELLKKQPSSNSLLLFENVFFLATPTLSFRTLMPIETPDVPLIKLPIAVQATSVVRTLSPCSTAVALQMTLC